jgi:predicted NodU family carbamoyl transferase
MPRRKPTGEQIKLAVRLCNSGGILINGTMAERRVAELLATEQDWLEFAQTDIGVAVEAGVAAAAEIQERLDKAVMFCKGMLLTPAMNLDQRHQLIEEMRAFIRLEVKLREGK